MYHGIINVYKEKGYTSHDVVAVVRRIVGQKKVGHTGTLDPNAKGVLPICVGQGTKAASYLTDSDKEYRAVLRLGMTTDTQDVWGQTLTSHPVGADVTEKVIRDTIRRFEGRQEQIPPMYSAVKVQGKKLYELARRGVTVERRPRTVTFYQICIERIELPRIIMRVSCSKGSYIRTLCHDIGAALGCGGCMEALTRTKAGPFLLSGSIRLDDLKQAVNEGDVSRWIIPVDTLFSEMPSFLVKERYAIAAKNGHPLAGYMTEADCSRKKPSDHPSGGEITPGKQEVLWRGVLPDGRFIGLYAYIPEKDCYRLRQMFFVQEEVSVC